MRDLDRWKDKVEISLDGRQIFFLFFGSAVAACLIFVVGVLIGKRIEARALALQPPAIEDPLAALDQLGDADEADEGLTFHKALTPAKSDKPEAKSEAKPEAKIDPKKEVVAAKAPAAKPPVEKVEKVEKKTAAVEKKAAPTVADDDADEDDSAPEPKKVDAKKPDVVKASALPAARPQVVPQVAMKKPDVTASHFTLQLSAFPDKGDAEEFMHKIQTAGYKPFLVASEIPGKGIFYRVRVGDFGSRQAAVDAKSEFEKKQRIIAYVAKL
ncbi:MAG TPA: SPOR domain-containing protein [Polyangia bacterium]